MRDPAVFLMDEPLSNLDAKLRNQMRAEIIKLRERINTTFIYVTHDQTEAMTLGDRIVIMRDGYIQQIGTPQEVFNNPRNLFVAGFIGTPQMNFFDAKLLKENGKYYVQLANVKVELSPDKQERLLAKDVQPRTLPLACVPSTPTWWRGGVPAKVDVSEMMGFLRAPAPVRRGQGRYHHRPHHRHEGQLRHRRQRQLQLQRQRGPCLLQGDREEPGVVI